jgi:hypothetical protein
MSGLPERLELAGVGARRGIVAGVWTVAGEPVNRASGLAVAVASPPTLAACQSPDITGRVSPSRRVTHSRSVRLSGNKESFFSPGATRPPPCRGEGEIHASHSRRSPAFERNPVFLTSRDTNLPRRHSRACRRRRIADNVHKTN